MALAALLSVLVGAVLSQGMGTERSPSLPAQTLVAASHEGFWSLPAAAQGRISGALGAGSPVYRVSGASGAFHALSPSQRLSTRFSPAGIRLSSGTVNVGLSLRAVGYGSSLQSTPTVTPSARANRVSYARASLREWYVNGPAGLEQGFTIPRSPSSHPVGPLTLSIALSGNAHASLSGDGQALALSHAGSPSLRYGELAATDAGGRTLHSWLTVQGATVLLRVDTAGAHYPLAIDPLIQQGEKLTGGGEVGEGQFGISTAVSADGNTALIGGTHDDGLRGAVWVFTRSGSGWIQQGPKLTGSEEVSVDGEEQCLEEPGEEPGECSFGRSVALSADGDTALIGDPSATARHGNAWVFTRSGSTWTRQETLTGPNEAGEGRFGKSVALSADGNTALIGDPSAEVQHGTAWVFTRSGSTWSVPGQALAAGERSQRIHFGRSVALSSDGGTALIGDPGDSGYLGSAWVLTRQGSAWVQHGEALRGGNESGEGHFGYSVALSGDGETALIAGLQDNGGLGAAWVFAESGSSFTQLGKKLTGAPADGEANFGYSVALSADGHTALIGAPRHNGGHGAVRVLTRAGAEWSEQEEQLAGSGQVGQDWLGASVALSADAKVALVGAPRDNRKAGGAWGFVDEPPTVPPTVTKVEPNSGPAGGGTRVSISGTNFTGTTAVNFGSSGAGSVVVNSAISIEAVSPAEPEGTVADVTVTTPAGTSAASKKDHFTFGTPTKGGKSGGSPSDPPESGASAGGSTGAVGVLGLTAAASAGCKVSLSKKRIAVAPHNRAALRLLRTGTGLCRGKLTLSYKVRKTRTHIELKPIGAAGFSISPGSSQLIRIKLNRVGQALLAKGHGRLTASLAILRLSPAPRQVRTASVRLNVQKPRKAITTNPHG